MVKTESPSSEEELYIRVWYMKWYFGKGIAKLVWSGGGVWYMRLSYKHIYHPGVYHKWKYSLSMWAYHMRT